MTEAEEKKLFAIELLKTPNEPFVAALKLFPNNNNRALRIATEWPRDSEVLEIIQGVKDGGKELDFLPSKADLARKVWDKLEQPWHDADGFTKLGKLYADVLGFIPKAGGSNLNVQINNNKVMVIRDQGTNEQWEEKAVKQQRELLNVSRSRH